MLSIWIPQVAAFLAAIVVAWAAKHQWTLDQTATTAFFVGTFTVIKTAVSSKLNPGNVANSALVDGPIREVRAMRRSRGN